MVIISMMAEPDDESRTRIINFKEVLKWISKLEEVFIMYIIGKTIVFLLLQMRYELLQSSYRHFKLEGNSTMSEKALAEVEHFRQVMRSVGVSVQDMSVFAMLGFSLSVCLYLAFNYGDKLLAGGEFSSRIGVDLYLLANQKPKLADRKLSLAFDKVLHELIAQNDNKRRSLLINLQRGDLNWDQANRIAGEVRQQQAHLRHLLRDKSSIWPKNRDATWRKKQQRFALITYLTIFMHAYIITVLLVVFSEYYAHWMLKERGDTPLNGIERWSFNDWFFVTLTYKTVDPIVILIGKLSDCASSLVALNAKFEKLDSQLVQIKEQTSTVAHKSSTERQALELYLMVRVYMGELRITSYLISFISKQFCLTAVTLLIFTVPFYSVASMSQLAVLAFITLDFTIFTNVVLLSCAMFDVGCTKTFHRAWSLVAKMTTDQIDTVGTANISDRDNRSLYRQLASDVYEGHFRLVGGGYSTINSQTVMLWRKFVTDMLAIRLGYQCRISGFIKLNYVGVLHMNFWFISIIMTFITQSWTSSSSRQL